MPGTATTSSPRTTSGQPRGRSAGPSRRRTRPAPSCAARRGGRRPPPPYFKAGQPDSIRQPPTDRASSARARLEPEPVVLAHRLHAAAESTRFEPTGEASSSASVQRAAARGARARARMFARRRGGCAEQRQDLVADQAAHRGRVRRVAPYASPRSRQYASVSSRHARGAAARRRPRGEPRSRCVLPRETSRKRIVSTWSEACGRSRAASPARDASSGRRAAPPRSPSRGALDALRRRTVAAEARVLVRLRAAQAVVDVQRRDAIAELAAARARDRSSRRRPRRGRAPRRPARPARARGCGPRCGRAPAHSDSGGGTGP